MSNPDEQGVTNSHKKISVQHFLQFLRPWLDDDDVTEICLNRPGEVFVETSKGWERHECEGATLPIAKSLATAVASYCSDDISFSRPILSATLPDGERAQFLMPPACEDDTISITIRKPSLVSRTLEDYERDGFFDHVKGISNTLSKDDQRLKALLAEGSYSEFLRGAVAAEKVIVVAGETGSGKTTFMKSLIRLIPSEQRIITIEDVPELDLPLHPNHVRLFYPSEAVEASKQVVSATTLLKSCLRMKPDRIMLAELRGSETFDFINVAASGHGGSITSCHAGSCELAFERLALMVLQNEQGQTLPYEVIRRLLTMVVDVVVHAHHDADNPQLGRHITEIWFRPEDKLVSPDHSQVLP